MNTAAIPLAVVGAGAMGRMHAQCILRTPGVRLAGVIETDPVGQAWCSANGIACAPDADTLWRRERPAGVVIATPNATHVPLAQDWLARGVPVLVEKPIADDLDAARHLVQLQQQAGIPVLVGHHRRHNPIVQRARAWIQEGRLGRVVTATVLATFFKPDAYFDLAWRREPGGGPVLINLIHEIDMLLHLLGDVVAVQARTSQATRGFPVEDTAAAVLEFAGGTLATVCLSDTAASPWNWDLCAGEQDAYPRQPVQSHFFMGTHGSLSLPDLSFWRYPGERHWHRELAREQTALHRCDVYALQLQHFLRVIAGEQEPLCSAADGARTLQVTRELLRSAAHP